MKPSPFPVMECCNRWSDMKGDHSDKICEIFKQFFYDIPTIPKPDSIKYFIGLEAAKNKAIEALAGIAEEYAEDLASEQEEASEEAALIDQYKSEVSHQTAYLGEDNAD